MKIVICGCGALGSQLGMHLAHPEREFVLVDDDRVGQENIGTSVFWNCHVGVFKVKALATMMYRKCGCEAEPLVRTVGQERSYLFSSNLVVDTFDNPRSRRLLCRLGIPTIHVGVSDDGLGAVMWDDVYPIPTLDFERGESTFCTHQAGRNILRTTAALAATIIEEFLESGECRSVYVDEHLETWR